jgi:hypothetical protein
MSINRIISYVLLGCCTLISACEAKPVGVGVHAVNYTEDEITYRIVDPADKENRAGGESINSYGAGGLMCCYSVPTKWRPGIKVELQAEVWLTSQPVGPDGKPKVEKQTVTLDLPKPVDDKPSELWVIRNPDGKFDLVASNFGPSHPRWPGKMKGSPLPSKSYLQKLLRRDLAKFEETLRMYQEDREALTRAPDLFAKEQWEYDVGERGKTDIANTYSGPTDPRYIEHLKANADEMVDYANRKISEIKRGLQ